MFIFGRPKTYHFLTQNTHSFVKQIKSIFSLLLAISSICLPFKATADDEPKLSIMPTARILIDGALYASPQKSLFPDGMAIPEARIGAKMRYGAWSAMIDASYSYAKVGMRNMWIQYDFNQQNAIRIGNFIHQYGYQNQSQSLKETFEQPIAATLYTPGIQLGAMYTHWSPSFMAAASFHVESSALQQVMNAPLFNQQGFSLLTRLVWRTPQKGQFFWHAGISGGYSSPQRRVVDNDDIHDGFTISANFPTKVVQLQEVGMSVGKSRNLFKFTPELVAAYGRMAFIGQYFFQQINRRDGLRSYVTQSGYATLRGMLIGKGYTYDPAAASIATPAPKTLECVLNYNYCDLADGKAGLFGGRANTFSVTFNYQFNKYITGRLNYFYTHRWELAGADPMTLNGFQARLMVLF